MNKVQSLSGENLFAISERIVGTMGASYPTSNQAGMKFQVSTEEDLREDLHFLSDDFPVAVYTQHFKSAASDQIPLHWHDDLQATWVCEGEVEYRINGDCFTLSGNRLLLINRRQLHSSRVLRKDALTLCMNFTPDIFHPVIADRLLRPFLENLNFSYLLLPTGPYQATLLRRFVTWRNDPLEYFPVMNFLSIVFEEILREHAEKKTPEDYVEMAAFQKALDYVHTHYADHLTIREIAGSVPINKNLLTSLFNKYTNMPPMKYLSEYRLNIARSMLLHTDKRVSDISIDVGYNQLSHFIEQFRINYGMSPLKFRMKHATSKRDIGSVSQTSP